MTKENAQPQTTASSKTCPKCGETKSTEEFHKNKYRKDGLRVYCKPCSIEGVRKWQRENATQVRTARRKRYIENAEKEREYGRDYYAANAEKARERRRKQYAANPARDLEYNRKWRERNPDKVFAYTQEELAKRSSRVARIRKMMAHFAGRIGWLEKLSAAIAMRSDAQGLCWIAADIDELLLIHFYKEV